MSNLLYPKLSEKLKAADLPDQLDIVVNSLDTLLDHILIKQSITNVDPYSNCTSYYYELGYQNGGQETPIQLKIQGTELALTLNKNPNGGASEFPISVLVDKKGIGLLGDIYSASQLSTNVADYLDPLLKYLKLTGPNLLYTMVLSEDVIAGCDNFERVSAILLKIKEYYPINLTPAQLDEQDTWGNVIKIVSAIEDLNEDDLEVIYHVFILQNNDAVNTIHTLFRQHTGDDIMQYLRDILIPYIEAHAVLQPAIEIPRSILVPAQNDDGIRKVSIQFGKSELFFNTYSGFSMAADASVSMVRAMIANTGFTIEFSNAKLDLSKISNISEATAAGYPEDFMGVYIERATIYLPQQFSGSSLQLVGKNILIGTGGFSGTIGLEATGTMWANIGGFRIGFNKFDLTFKQNAVVSSNIQAKLEIPQFKDQSRNPLQIDVIGHISENGDFNLTASVSQDIQASLCDVVNFEFKTFELGRQGNDFYLGTSCEVLNTRVKGIKLCYLIENRVKNAA